MNKRIDYDLGLPYTIELIADPEGGWFVAVRELPGCMSQGDTPQEAIEMIQDAMHGWLEVALEDGDSIPEPREIEDYSGKFLVRVPRSLHRDLIEMAEREGVSLNQYICTTLARSVGRPGAAGRAEVEATGWPGLKSAIKQVLTAAGMTPEAQALDERLFANWADQILVQVDSGLQGRHFGEVLGYLNTLGHSLKAGVDTSPVLATLYRAVSLLHHQVESMAQVQAGAMNDLTMRSRISGYARGANRSMAKVVLQEERVAYSATTTSESHFERPQHADW